MLAINRLEKKTNSRHISRFADNHVSDAALKISHQPNNARHPNVRLLGNTVRIRILAWPRLQDSTRRPENSVNTYRAASPKRGRPPESPTLYILAESVLGGHEIFTELTETASPRVQQAARTRVVCIERREGRSNSYQIRNVLGLVGKSGTTTEGAARLLQVCDMKADGRSFRLPKVENGVAERWSEPHEGPSTKLVNKTESRHPAAYFEEPHSCLYTAMCNSTNHPEQQQWHCSLT